MTTMIATMPGNWPGDTEVISRNELLHPKSPTIPPKSPRRAHITNLAIPVSPMEPVNTPSTKHLTQPSEPIHDVDELFFNVGNNNEAASASYLIFEPVVSSVSKTTSSLDWKRYEPPQELLVSSDDTPQALKGILAESIDRIQAGHRKEEEQRIAAARRGKPLRRGAKASMKPKHEPMMSGALDPSVLPQPSRTSMGSGASLYSLDSGYGSRSPNGSDVSPMSSPEGGKGFLSGLTSRFRQRDVEKRLSPLQKLGEMSNVLTLLNVEGVKETAKEVSVKETTAVKPTTVECVSCLDEFEARKMIKLTCHSYCAECFQRLVNNAMESETHWPVKCCLNTIPTSLITSHLTSRTLAKFKSRSAEWSMPACSRIYCSLSTCSIWLPPSTLNTKRRIASCPSCTTQTCTTCRGPSHKGSDCPQDPALLATMNLAEMEGWKRCYSCNALVEHNQGCRHMTCRCKAQFCYICGLRWRTCGCTDAQLEGIQARAARRRGEETRTARERAAEEEERENLRMVEEFVRQETEREAAAAAAEWRREEQRRHEEEEARRRVEESRIAFLRTKYTGFITSLETLHDSQRTLLSVRHEIESSQLTTSLTAKLDALSLRHAQESQLLALDSQTKVSDLEHDFKMQYHARLMEERKIEDSYVDELAGFWRGKDGGEMEVRRGRDELRRVMEREFEAWNEWWRGEMEVCQRGEETKRVLLQKRHVSERKEVKGRGEIDEVEMGWKREAEGRWVEDVVAVRADMVREMERVEVEGGLVIMA